MWMWVRRLSDRIGQHLGSGGNSTSRPPHWFPNFENVWKAPNAVRHSGGAESGDLTAEGLAGMQGM